MLRSRIVAFPLVLTILALASSGCLMAGNYHSAKTLEKGTSKFGATFSFITYEFETVDETGQPNQERFTLPNLIPELTYHVGVTDDVELGGRVALGSLALEGDAKFRFFKTDRLHLALAPAIGYQAAFLVQGTSFRLPGLLTYDLADNFGINVAIFGATTHYDSVDEDEAALKNFRGTLASTGLAIGFDIRGETLVIRPSVEWTRYLADFSSDQDFDEFSTVSINVHIGFIGGREKKQLNRMERKLDRVIDDVEGRPHHGEPPITDDSDYEPMK